MIKIKDLQTGYTLNYEPGNRQFYVVDSEATNIANATTQDEVESKLDKYIKAQNSKRCPADVIKDDMNPYTITSFDAEDNSVWVKTRFASRYDKAGARSKSSLIGYDRQPNFYEVTENNMALMTQHQKLQAEIQRLQNEARLLQDKLEKPITAKWFSEV